MIQYNENELMAYFEKAAEFSSTKRGVTRLYCSQEHKNFIPVLKKWMQEAGLQTKIDAIGNVIGFKPGKKSNKKLIIGSHQDTVIEGGKYDGILGVLLPLYILQKYHEHGVEFDYGIELVAFGDEEGVRFPETLLGSKALCGNVDKTALQVVDKDGISLKEALTFIGANPDDLAACKRKQSDIIGYFEVHIEQGPILEQKNLPVGVVTAITGIQRHRVFIQGQANHAGTTPMDMRKDALLAAAQIITFANAIFTKTDNLVGVVGELNVQPNAVNVIPDRVDLTIEIRSPSPEIRHKAAKEIEAFCQSLATKQNLEIQSSKNYEMNGAICDKDLQKQLEEAIQENQITPFSLFSGAGHDGLAIQALSPISMLFLRCEAGISHHFKEEIKPDDAIIAAKVIDSFLRNLQYDSTQKNRHLASQQTAPV
ncbi:M20 family metallo-hydrolase [Facilibium subflavum]|uniref:M20 family metallo-hydrolase n=1 Tax=Facilibium subflavum TaxID=2219058 RepID=UPI000E65064A|nr:M20 family metallo-hydrolase [Facilibium subflavum]